MSCTADDLPLEWSTFRSLAPPAACSAETAILLPASAKGAACQPGSLHYAECTADGPWHFHDMHQLSYAFDGAMELESARGRNLVPRQLAAWIPAGVPHRVSFRGVRWISVFLPARMLPDRDRRVRAITVCTLMREMMREAIRWPICGAESPLRAAFFEAMAQLCGEWITREADLFLPACNDARVKRALGYTNRRMDWTLAEVCRHAGISVRSLRRHLKAETGMTWEEYRYRSRLVQAISALAETETPIADIATRCGFGNPSSFAKVFRLQMGETPRQYRNRVSSLASDDVPAAYPMRHADRINGFHPHERGARKWG